MSAPLKGKITVDIRDSAPDWANPSTPAQLGAVDVGLVAEGRDADGPPFLQARAR